MLDSDLTKPQDERERELQPKLSPSSLPSHPSARYWVNVLRTAKANIFFSLSLSHSLRHQFVHVSPTTAYLTTPPGTRLLHARPTSCPCSHNSRNTRTRWPPSVAADCRMERSSLQLTSITAKQLPAVLLFFQWWISGWADSCRLLPCS